MFRPAVKARVILNTKDDKAFSGVLWKSTRRYVVLKDAALFEGENPTPVDGDVLVDCSNVSFLVVAP